MVGFIKGYFTVGLISTAAFFYLFFAWFAAYELGYSNKKIIESSGLSYLIRTLLFIICFGWLLIPIALLKLLFRKIISPLIKTKKEEISDRGTSSVEQPPTDTV